MYMNLKCLCLRTTEPHNKLHLLGDFVLPEVVGSKRQRVNIEGSGYKDECLQTDDGG